MSTFSPSRRLRAAAAATDQRSFASGARILSIGIGLTGLFTFAYLATASHVLSKSDYSRISLCWSVMFVILSVLYRPIEQLLSRTIADGRARPKRTGSVLRTPALLQAAFAAGFVIVALALRPQIEDDLLGHAAGLYWVLVVGVLAYAASYFARGWLAGNRRFGLYGALVFQESTSRLLFALAVAAGFASGREAVGLGMAAAPVVSLTVIPFALTRMRDGAALEAQPPGRLSGRDVEVADAALEGPAHEAVELAATDLSLRRGGRFAAAVVIIMLAEQTLMNAGVIVVAANTHFDLTLGLTGFVFNALLIVRAPLQLFQAVQTSILPHLTSMQARASLPEFRRTVRMTVLATSSFGVAVALGLLAVGPAVMGLAVGHGFTYGRIGLAVIGLGMGLHLTAGALNQALLARERAGAAAVGWAVPAVAFVLFVALPTIGDEVTRVEVGYCAAAGLLTLLLWLRYRSSEPAPG